MANRTDNSKKAASGKAEPAKKAPVKKAEPAKKTAAKKAEPARKAPARKAEPVRKAKDKKSRKKVIILGIYLAAVVIASVIAGIILAKSFKGGNWNSFVRKVNAYGTFLTENRVPDDLKDYRALLSEAREAVKNKDKSKADELSDRIDAATRQLAEDSQGRNKLLDLRDEYDEKFSKYEITEDLQAGYDELFREITEDIRNYDGSSYRSFKERFEGFETNLKSSNETLIRTIKNSISLMDMSEASDVEKDKMDGYREEAESLVSEGNYKEAIAVYNKWKILAAEIDAREPDRDLDKE